jgi:hypothetical protein
MNRTLINRANAQETGHAEAVSTLNRPEGRLYSTRETFQLLGQHNAEQLYSKVTRPLFLTGWMAAWDARHPDQDEDAEAAGRFLQQQVETLRDQLTDPRCAPYRETVKRQWHAFLTEGTFSVYVADTGENECPLPPANGEGLPVHFRGRGIGYYCTKTLNLGGKPVYDITFHLEDVALTILTPR